MYSRQTGRPNLAVSSKADHNSGLTVYPEGTNVICRFNAARSDAMLELYNSIGMKILEVNIMSGETMKSFDIRNLSSGVYFVRYSAGSTTEIRSVNIVR